jgi:large subunit ribosomal protein L6
LLIFINMKKDLERVIELPEGFSAEKIGNEVVMKGNSKELRKKFDFGRLNFSVEGSNIKLSASNGTRRESKVIGTIEAHLKNMIKGLQEGFTYELEICNVHFPMNVKVEGDKVSIKSFLGEKKDRFAKIAEGSEVKIKGNQIVVTSDDIEKAGQTATNLEKAAVPKARDRRIFQDGIFLVKKNGREI